jgi:hypothetical protein
MADLGSDLALFPSYRFLRRFPRGSRPRARIIEQHEKLTSTRRRDSRRSRRRRATACSFSRSREACTPRASTAGREALGGVTSPSLPQVSFERELKRYFDDQENPASSSPHPARSDRVIQAAGRLFRSETDRVVALLCRQFVEDPYRRYLPRTGTTTARTTGLPGPEEA